MMRFAAAILCMVLLASVCFAQDVKEGAPCARDRDCACGQRCVEDTPGVFKCYTLPGIGWYEPCKAQIESQWNFWGPVAALGVLVAFLVVAFAYMIGIGFDMRELRMWAKSELYQALASAVLVGMLISMTYVMLDEGFANILGANVNPYFVANRYLDSISTPLIGWYRNFYNLNYPLEALTTLYSYENANPGEQYVLQFLKPILVDPWHFANHFIIQILIIVYFQQAMLAFFQAKMFAAVFPLGIFLRTFPITRGAGGLLIALSIGFFFVYPTIFAFVAKMTEEGSGLNDALNTSNLKTIGIDFATFTACEHDFEEAARQAEESANPEVLAKVNQFHSFMPPVIMKALFFPMIIFAVVISFIRIAAPILGADISEVGQGLVKLI